MKNYRFKAHRIVCFVVFFNLFYCVFATALAGSVTTTLTLPPGSYTLPSNMEVWVRAIAVDGDPGDYVQSLQSFSAATDGPGSEKEVILSLENDHNYVLQYDCSISNFPLPCRQIVSQLFYNSSSSNGTVFRRSEGEVLSGSLNHTGIDLPIQTGTIFSGILQTPNAQNATEDIDLSVVIRSVATPLTDLLGVSYTIPMGSNSVNYEIHVPDDPSESWYVGYNCIPVVSAPCEQVLLQGYRNSAAVNNTVEHYADADELAGGVNRSGLNFRLLGGFTISGSIIVPVSVADAAGLRVSVKAQDRNDPTNSSADNVLIAQSETTGDYFMTVSVDPSALWIVNYNCEINSTPVECSEYIQKGYYNNGVMVESSLQVDMPLAGGESHTGVDLTLLTGSTFSGSVVLSDGESPAGGLTFAVRTFETTGSGVSASTTVIIPEGESEASFSINVGAGVDNEYRLSYDCNEALTIACENVVDEGFYDALNQTTVYVEEDAVSLVNNGLDVPGLVLTVNSPGLLPPEEVCVAVKTAAATIALFCL